MGRILRLVCLIRSTSSSPPMSYPPLPLRVEYPPCFTSPFPPSTSHLLPEQARTPSKHHDIISPKLIPPKNEQIRNIVADALFLALNTNISYDSSGNVSSPCWEAAKSDEILCGMLRTNWMVLDPEARAMKEKVEGTVG